MRRPIPLLLLALLAGCATSPPPMELSYRCSDGTTFIARGGGEKITLVFDDRSWTLPRVHSGSGVKYTDRELLFWEKGDEAILATGHRMIHCQVSK